MGFAGSCFTSLCIEQAVLQTVMLLACEIQATINDALGLSPAPTEVNSIIPRGSNPALSSMDAEGTPGNRINQPC